MVDENLKHKSMRRGIYLLPNLFTTAALAFGFLSITSSMQENFGKAALLIIIASILDALDGRVARLTNTQTPFGAQYDSLSDIICFGLAPAILLYSWSLSPLGNIGIFAAFVYVAAAALRLARFNTNHDNEDSDFFRGLPSPAAALTITTFVWQLHNLGEWGEEWGIVSAIVVIATALLMISNFPYHSFKGLNLKNTVPFRQIIMLMMIIAIIFINPALIIFLCTALYVLSAPILFLFRKIKKHKKPHA